MAEAMEVVEAVDTVVKEVGLMWTLVTILLKNGKIFWMTRRTAEKRNASTLSSNVGSPGTDENNRTAGNDGNSMSQRYVNPEEFDLSGEADQGLGHERLEAAVV